MWLNVVFLSTSLATSIIRGWLIVTAPHSTTADGLLRTENMCRVHDATLYLLGIIIMVSQLVNTLTLKHSWAGVEADLQWIVQRLIFSLTHNYQH
jgi:hypothetical protein